MREQQDEPGFDELLNDDEADAAVDERPDEASGGSADDAPVSRVKGWGRVFRGNRALWITAAVALVSLVAGLVLGRFIIAPGSADDSVPDAGLITVPVDFGELSNDVTIRADVGFADAVRVTLDTSSVSGPAVVTGQVPAVGSELHPLSIAMEVAGRPVIVLPGELPAYRTLRFGVSGPDVVQLKQALQSVGINPGDLGSNVFDQALADAVAALYTHIGYPLPPLPEGAEDAFRAAQEHVRSAENSLAQARTQYSAAAGGPSEVEIRQADNAVAQAQDNLALMQAQVPAGAEPGSPEYLAWQNSVREAQRQLDFAVLQREAMWANAGSGADWSIVAAAQDGVNAAHESLERARQAVQPYLPSSEVLYLTQLPRRVDAVNVQRGSVLSGETMTVSGATIRLSGSAAEADARLLKVGMEGTFELPGGELHRAVISEVTAGRAATDRWTVLLTPDELTTEQLQSIQGTNVRVQISVGATEGEVLHVPLAALTAGPGGESRVEVVEGDPRDGDRARTRLVVVRTGLAAQGEVEITPVEEGTLAEGDLVVVGR